ncbi:MAG: hypothetical protein CMO55_09045 [Verrucomicrobiales bacterium]|nr:hypothetical protein [Verrucomicrobiales bacterium]
MKSVIEPYLFFGGRTEEAIEFYGSVLDAKLEMLMRYDEAPDAPPEGMLAEGWEKKVMHASFFVGESRIMASDGCGGEEEGGFDAFRLSIAPETEEEAKKIFDGLAEGGEVAMPLGKTFWSPCFGMVTDKFGLGWMVNVVDPNAEG